MSSGTGSIRRGPDGPSVRRDPVPELRGDFAPRAANPRRRVAEDDTFGVSRKPAKRGKGWQLKLGSSVPRSAVGRVATGLLVLAGFGAVAYGLYAAQTSLLHDARLVIPQSDAIEISGNQHLSRAQLLSVFGEDVDRNVLMVPLDGRRAELEALPWVEHATVMRLLPNRVRVSIVERTPVAFVRQGNSIGLVDAHGVLLDLSPDVDAQQNYSFPVITGISGSDPASTRLARMKIYREFTGALDAGPEKISKKLSEVDLSDPMDVKALIPDNGAEVLVHFGEDHFLERYQRYEQNLADWRTKYPKLASVDMQYEHEVVLEMAPGSAVTVADATPGTAKPVPSAVSAKKVVAVKKPAWKATPWSAVKAKVVARPVVQSHAKAVAVKPARGPR